MRDRRGIRYFLYARKSSEAEDRQIQSITDQLDRMKQVAAEQGHEIVEVFSESVSAKESGKRSKFEEMMERIENGEADGILSWQFNRISRNPLDTGRVQYFLQRGVIKSIITIDREYLPEDNALLLSVEGGVATQFIADLRRNTVRGITAKLEKGGFPGLAPVGYLNDQVEKTIVKDPERFEIVRMMWDKMLTGCCSPPQILDIANNEWGFRTKKHKKSGGKELSRSGIYRIFNNPFYMGQILYDGKLYQGKHEPMITIEEFERVQQLLGMEGKAKPQKHRFSFTGLIRCGECGCSITALKKVKAIKSTGEIREYIYYYCTQNKKDVECSQHGGIREETLEAQIEEILTKYTIMPEFRDWALEILEEENEREARDRERIYENQHKAITETQRYLDNLIKMRFKDMISDEDYNRERDSLTNKLTDLKARLREIENRAEQWVGLAERAFDFAAYAREAFTKGDLDTKRTIFQALGQNFTLLNRKLSIEPSSWLVPIAEAYPGLEEEYLALELAEKGINKGGTEAETSVRIAWGE